MKRIICAILFLFCFIVHANLSWAQSPGENIRISDNWKFWHGGAMGAEKPDFNDTAWRTVQLPHDWSIEDLPGTTSPFTIHAIGQASTGFTVGGTAWYRRYLHIPQSDSGHAMYLQFDGIYMNAEVWVNGRRAARNAFGYTSFVADISRLLKYDTTNVIAVKVRNEGENTRYYSGSGIYRHVWLRKAGLNHIVPWGTFVTTPDIGKQQAVVRIETTTKNTTTTEHDITWRVSIKNSTGTEVQKGELQYKNLPGKNTVQAMELKVNNPALWHPDNPHLYTVVNTIIAHGQVQDVSENSFGIRSIALDTSRGFLLNGQPLLLKGGCIHHDNGPLGAKAIDRAEYRKIELLKQAGYNAIRTAHNPPSPALLDACDKLGMLVINEAFDMWADAKNPFDHSLFFTRTWETDIENMLLRDRNHPSIIMWSTGNEIYNKDRPAVVEVAKKLADKIRSLDSTRFITNGVNGISLATDAFMAPLDIVGYNYEYKRYEEDHARVPNRMMYGSESYALDAFENWKAVERLPYVIGDFVWTAYDYLGEAALGWMGWQQFQTFFPWTLAFSGDIDICGWKRPQSYYRDAIWKKNALSVFVKSPVATYEDNSWKAANSRWEWHDEYDHWNWPEHSRQPLTVSAYSSCDDVELWLNNKSLGRKPTHEANKYIATWQVPYAAGELKAIGYTNKKKVSEQILRTATVPTQIKISPDRNTITSDGQDLSYITIEFTDEKGVRPPITEQLIKFTLDGPGKIIGVGNANPKSIESYTLPQRTTWKGRCIVIVQSTGQKGKITLKAQSGSLPFATVEIMAQ